MRLEDVTPVILTRDEEANIERTLRQLEWAADVLIVDSYSNDKTLELASRFPNVRWVKRELDTLAGQSNFGLAEARTPWVMLLDADYFVPDDFVRELAALEPPPGTYAYIASFIYAVHGRRLRASLYPPRVVLLRRDHASVWQDGHAHRIRIDGDTGTLNTKIVHDDRKTFGRFLARQRKYMRQEAQKLRTADPHTLNTAAKIRKLIGLAPVAVAVHTLFVRRLILDGWPGLVYTFERVVAEMILSWEMVKTKLKIEN